MGEKKYVSIFLPKTVEAAVIKLKKKVIYPLNSFTLAQHFNGLKVFQSKMVNSTIVPHTRQLLFVVSRLAIGNQCPTKRTEEILQTVGGGGSFNPSDPSTEQQKYEGTEEDELDYTAHTVQPGGKDNSWQM